MDAQPSYLEQLFASGLLLPTGVDGLYGRSRMFEDVLERMAALLGNWGRTRNAELLRFPPGMQRDSLVRAGYFKSFPQLAGTIHAFCGNDRDHRQMLRCMDAEDPSWLEMQQPTDVAMTPAACYPVYPITAARGPLPEEGRLFDVRSWCFRREPSLEPTRMQMFQMQEYVRIGTADQVLEFRNGWMEYGKDLFTRLRVPHEIDVANDPFFGRSGKLMAESQREQKFKFELLIPVNSVEKPTACMSFNYHGDHFGLTWGIRTEAGGAAHTACIGFGLERITLALFRHHGLDADAWPEDVRAVLWS
jgi:seryl-tRNA synthetase